jgi:hypothetical protein
MNVHLCFSTLRNSELHVILHVDAGPDFACLGSAVTTSNNTDMITFCVQRLVSGSPSGYPHSMSHEFLFQTNWYIPAVGVEFRVHLAGSGYSSPLPRNSAHQVGSVTSSRAPQVHPATQ